MKINFEFDDATFAFCLVSPIAILCIFLLFMRGCEGDNQRNMERIKIEQKANSQPNERTH